MYVEHLSHFGLSRDPFANDSLISLFFEDDAFTLQTSAPFTVTPGDTEMVSLLFHPVTEGLYEDFLQITCDDPDPEEATVLVDLTGQGVMPLLKPDSTTCFRLRHRFSLSILTKGGIQ